MSSQFEDLFDSSSSSEEDLDHLISESSTLDTSTKIISVKVPAWKREKLRELAFYEKTTITAIAMKAFDTAIAEFEAKK